MKRRSNIEDCTTHFTHMRVTAEFREAINKIRDRYEYLHLGEVSQLDIVRALINRDERIMELAKDLEF